MQCHLHVDDIQQQGHIPNSKCECFSLDTMCRKCLHVIEGHDEFTARSTYGICNTQSVYTFIHEQRTWL